MLEIFEFDLTRPIPPENLNWLAPDEVARAQAFRFEQLRQRYICGRLALRQLLSRFTGQPPASIRIDYNAWGKPEVRGGPHFNVSNSRDLALVAVGEAGPVGVDVEVGMSLSAAELDGVLSPDERSMARRIRLEDDDRVRLWVRKESVLKVLGKGVSYDPCNITVGFPAVDLHRCMEVRLTDGGRELACQALDLDLGPGILAAVSVLGTLTPQRVRLHRLDPVESLPTGA